MVHVLVSVVSAVGDLVNDVAALRLAINDANQPGRPASSP